MRIGFNVLSVRSDGIAAITHRPAGGDELLKEEIKSAVDKNKIKPGSIITYPLSYLLEDVINIFSEVGYTVEYNHVGTEEYKTYGCMSVTLTAV